MRKFLYAIVCIAVLLSSVAPSAQTWALGAPGSTQFYVNNQTGLAYVKNTTASYAVFMFALMNANNPNNQIDLGSRNAVTLAPGADAYLSVGLTLSRCKSVTVQPDIWINPPPVGPSGLYTLGELTLYGGGSTRVESGPMDGCGVVPTPTPTPQCEQFVMQFNFGPLDWIMTAPSWLVPSGIPGVWPFPSSVGPYSLALTGGIPAGRYNMWVTTTDPFHLTAFDGSHVNWNESLRLKFHPSLKVTMATPDIAADIVEQETYVGEIDFNELQTHVTAEHAGPVGVEAMDSLKPLRVRWQHLCP